MDGTCLSVAVGFTPPFSGRAATGGRDVRGSNHASEGGPFRDGKIKEEFSWLEIKTQNKETVVSHFASLDVDKRWPLGTKWVWNSLTCVHGYLAASRTTVNYSGDNLHSKILKHLNVLVFGCYLVLHTCIS